MENLLVCVVGVEGWVHALYSLQRHKGVKNIHSGCLSSSNKGVSPPTQPVPYRQAEEQDEVSSGVREKETDNAALPPPLHS